MFLFRGRETATSPDKQFNDLVDKIINTEQGDLSSLYTDLLNFIPSHTPILCEKLRNSMVMALRQSPLKDTSTAVLGVISKIVDLQDTKSMTILLEQPRFIPALFSQTNPASVRSLGIIEAFLKLSPDKFTEFIGKSPNTITPLIKGIAQSKNEQATQLALRILSDIPSAAAGIESSIKTIIRSLPVQLVTSLIQKNPNYKSSLPDKDVIQWILSSPSSLSVMDVKYILDTWKLIQSHDQFVAILLKADTDGGKGIEEVAWIHELRPGITVKAEYARKAGDLLSNEKETTSLSFLRLFILYNSNPDSVSDKGKAAVARLSLSKEDWVSAAAAQTILAWSALQYNPPLRLVYMAAAAIVDEDIDRGCHALFRALLMALGRSHTVVGSLIANEGALKYDESETPAIVSAVWAFPGIEKVLAGLKGVELVDYAQALDVVGFVSELLDL